MSCVRREELADYFRPGYIIQEAIDDIDLIDNRKYTLRGYVLVVKGSVYVLPEGVLVIHGSEYDPNDRSAEVQFLHTGYDKAGSPVEMRPFTAHPAFPKILSNLKRTVAESFSPFRGWLLEAEPDNYCLFGLDILVERSLETVLIEVNDRPNLVHTSAINGQVSIPALQAMLAVVSPVIGGRLWRPDPAFVKVLSV